MPIEKRSHTFVIRVWSERTESTLGSVEWRGVIEHVPSRRRQYLLELNTITLFISPYINALGADISRIGRIKSRLRSLLTRLLEYLCPLPGAC